MPTHPPTPTPPPPTPWARASQPHTRSRPLLLAAIRAPARGCTLVPPPPSLLPPCSSLALRRKRRGGRPRTPRALPPPCRRGRTACLFDPLPPLISTQTITRTHPSGHTSWVGAGRVGGWAGTGRVRGARGVHTQQGALPPRHPPPCSIAHCRRARHLPTHPHSLSLPPANNASGHGGSPAAAAGAGGGARAALRPLHRAPDRGHAGGEGGG